MTRLSRLLAQDDSSLPVISLENVKSKDLDAFLSVLYPLCVLRPSKISAATVSLTFYIFAQKFQRIGETLIRGVIIYFGLVHSVGFQQYP